MTSCSVNRAPILYYESAVVIVALILLGKHLEQRAKRQTTQAIQALQQLRPDVAHLLPDGKNRRDTQDVPSGELLPNDCVLAVGLLKSREEEIVIGGNEPGPITVSMRNELTGIQYGKVPDRHSWMVKLSR